MSDQNPTRSLPSFAAYPAWKRWLALCRRPMRRAVRQFRDFPPFECRRVMDVGAHQGEFTLAALNYYRPERVWLVEADQELASGLQQKFSGQPACKVIHAAIADTSGSVTFRINRHRASSSLLPISKRSTQIFQKDLQETDAVTVPALALDDLFAQEKIDRLDLLKVDIQGAERLLIQGGQRALQQVACIYIEVLFEELYEGCALFGEIDALLTPLGFKLRSFHEFRKGPDGDLVYTNALYVNRDL